MNALANAYKYISLIIDRKWKYDLSKQEVEALEVAQRAILAIELLGISATEKEKTELIKGGE